MGAEPEQIREAFPGVLAITGPQAYESVMSAVHEAIPPAHDPFLDLVPPQGVKLTPRHYAYLKISEGCHNRCSFCIIPKLRGDLVSRPIVDVLKEAEKLANAGVKELLVISQDTLSLRRRHQVSVRHLEGSGDPCALLRSGRCTLRVRHLGAPALRLSLSACRRGHLSDGRRQGAAVSGHPLPARLTQRAPRHAAGRHTRRRRPSASPSGARSARTLPSAPPSSSASPARRRKISRCCSTGCRR